MVKKKVLEHTCFQKEHPLSPVKCRCRKRISLEKAKELVAQGAQFVIVRYSTTTVEEPCSICEGKENLVKNCSYCGRSGKISVKKTVPVYGEDIIRTVGEKKNRLVNNAAKRTPRVPTIESKHIWRALGMSGMGSMAARSRWDEYELITLKERIRLLVDTNVEQFEIAWKLWEYDTSRPFPLPLREEPADDPKTGTGRRYDYGRSI